ncbi:polysaccharide deacetylase family protein [Nocardiopsis aegyptia]|uniref:Peptidoglycan/xylan/chitin deacetylase (PgdA/CDA1 family) n=1 Tax=Nocardiopsis aegyptia TaxID=220378 RepID=A0A7Z0JE01_9ACTN|nr:polysaccharide deacetylase family protein [Nocardiopsis aegyptia]NYJ38040.1 peptidoglycan/xylan/chitin deacetylase (PgdA/CDA1 family) [Nocardiopsis aegyptia]
MNATLSPQRTFIRPAVALVSALSACAALAAPAAAAAAVPDVPGPAGYPTSAVVGGLSGEPLDCARLKCVALTFDDGPGAYTDELLDTLAGYDAQATFYVLGSKVAHHTDTLQRMVEEGHEVGNHSWDHADLATLSADAVEKDMERTNEAIREATGTEPATMRPPYGSLDDTARSAIDQPMVLWDVDTLDWQSRDADTVTDVTLDETAPGSVVLFHDIHESTVEAVPAVLKGLHRQGYHFVTVDELFSDGMEPGDLYTDARL